MLKIKNVTMKNFMSVGAIEQSVDLDKNGITHVLGENLDMGGGGSRNGVGKAQPLTSNVLTPSGWRRMGDLQVNDDVIAYDGSIVKITGVYPQHVRHVYKFTFSDGRTCEASREHLWQINKKNKTRVLTTEEIIVLLERNDHSLEVPLYKPAVMDDIFLEIDPTTFGKSIHEYNEIPDHYKNSSKNQKVELLKSIFVTDCKLNCQTGTISYVSDKLSLCEDVAYIVRSIGGVATIKQDEDHYKVVVNCETQLVDGKITQKFDPKLKIISVEPIDDAECQCITIDHPSRLYVTDNFVVTHNSTLLSAISYGLYGLPVTNVKKDNLINKINQKNMSVSIDFEINNHKYRIERGRKPNFFKYIVDNEQVKSQDSDEAQGENKDTQAEIDQLIGMSHTLFKHIIGLNTYTQPFLDLGAAKQREIIEELLGITQLSKKADNLKELIKTTKIDIEKEEFRVGTIKNSNQKIQNTIQDFQHKVEKWHVNNENEIETIKMAIEQLEKIDIDKELELHNDADIYKELKTGINQFNKDIQTKNRHISQLETQLNNLLNQFSVASNKTCPMCEQGIKDHKHVHIMSDLESRIGQLDTQLNTERSDVEKLNEELNTLLPVFNGMVEPNPFYSTLKQALEHKNTLDQLHKDLIKEESATNPYLDQAEALTNTLQEISYDSLNTLVKSREHQEFLLKLLTNKDSFIRKRIIDQNLSYLNNRLEDYLDKLGLPYNVKFLNDLTTEILFLGQDLDFDNLSRGERTRVVIGLSLAFRDIFETMNTAVDLVFIDELLDAGLDGAGFELSMAVLKKMERERGKNIFIISHREELISRVTTTLSVIKEDGFTRFDYDYVSS